MKLCLERVYLERKKARYSHQRRTRRTMLNQQETIICEHSANMTEPIKHVASEDDLLKYLRFTFYKSHEMLQRRLGQVHLFCGASKEIIEAYDILYSLSRFHVI